MHSINTYSGTGGTSQYAVTFPYLSKDHVEVRIGGVLQTSGYSWINNSTLSITAPTGTNNVDIRRATPSDLPEVVFNDGSTLTDSDLNLETTHLLYIGQETADSIADSNNRTLHYPVGEVNTAGVLPASLTRAGMLLGFDYAGNAAMVPVPASIGAGDLRWDTFVAGVGFVAGVDNKVTLSRAPGSVANVEVFFDAAFQGPDQVLSLVGNVLTFTSVIPTGIQRVYVRSGTSLSLNVPPTGSIADSMVAAGAAIAAAKLGYSPTVGTLAASTVAAELDILRGQSLVSIERYGVTRSTTDDQTVAMQAALDSGKALWIPEGFWPKVSASLRYHPDTVIHGAGGVKCGIVAANTTFDVLVNDPVYKGDFYGGHFRGFTVRYGRYGFGISPVDDGAIEGVQSLCTWEDVRLERQGIRGLYCSKLFIGNTLRNVVFFYCGGGFYCGKESNLNVFSACRFEGLTDVHVWLDCSNTTLYRGGENNLFVNSRHEAIPPGSPDLSTKSIFVLNNAYATTMLGGYIENTFRNIVYSVVGMGMVFDSVWFTGQSVDNTLPTGTLKGETFDSSKPITFRNCKFFTGSNGCTTVGSGMILEGVNEGLETKFANVWRAYQAAHQNESYTTKAFSLSSGVSVQPLTFTRVDSTNAITNWQSVTGRMSVNIFGSNNAGVKFAFTREYMFRVDGFANTSPTMTLTQVGAIDNNSVSGTLTIGTNADSTHAWPVVTLTVPTMSYASCQITMDFAQNGSTANGQFNHSVTL